MPGDAICWNGSFVTGSLSSRGTSLGGPWCPLACESRVLMQVSLHVSVKHDELGGSLVIGGLVVVWSVTEVGVVNIPEGIHNGELAAGIGNL